MGTVRVSVLGVRFPPHHTGGYELHCAATVDGLRAAGHDVEVLTSDLREPAAGTAPDPVWVHRELRAFDPRGSWPGLRAAAAGERHNARVLAAHLRRFRPDVVCFWRMAELSVSLLERVRRAGVPAVGVVCDPWPLDAPGRDPWHRAVGHRLGGSPDWAAVARWVFVSRWLARRLAGAGLPMAPAGIAHAGLDLGRLAFRGPPGPWGGRLLYAGRLSALKGVDVAVRAVAQLPGTRLTVCGHGSPAAVAELRGLAAELGMARRLEVRPPLPADRMAELYAAHDAVLFPVTWPEPWGLVPLEAMAVGIPVVATGTGGSREYLRPGQNALPAAPGDAGALAAAVRRLAADGALRARLVAGGRRTAEAHPAERGTAVIARVLEDAAARRPPSAALAPAAPGARAGRRAADGTAVAAAH
jgi:glycosyltransferase involved in cell wall biosynthesis